MHSPLPADGRRRTWQLTEPERAALDAARDDRMSIGTVSALLLRSPRLVPEVLGSALKSAWDGIWGDSSLVWLLDAESTRRVVPRAASGVRWVPERFFVPFLEPLLAADVTALEIGCGGGRIARHVAPRVRELMCADASAAFLREARCALASFDNVRFVRTRGFALPDLPDGSFDLVYSQGVFSYLDPAQMLALLDELARVLREGGTLVVNAFTIDQPVSARTARDQARQSAARRRFSAGRPRPYTLGQVEALERAAGLTVVDSIRPASDDEQVPVIIFARRQAGPLDL